MEPSWRAFFQGFDFGLESVTDTENFSEVPESVKKEFQVIKLIDGYRTRGHLFTKTNPVRERRKYSPKLDIENFGLSKSDFKELNDIVEGDAKLKAFADQILSITKGDGYSKPGKNWAAGTITTDLMELLNTTKRGKY